MKGTKKIWNLPDKKPNFSFSREQVNEILGSDARLHDMYNHGMFLTEIMLHDRKSLVAPMCYVGYKDKKPRELLDLLWYIAPTSLGYVEEIYGINGQIKFLSVHSEGNCIVVDLHFWQDIRIRTVVEQDGGKLNIVQCDGHMFKYPVPFLGILKLLLKWVENNFIFDVYSIEYWLMDREDAYDNIGHGEYYKGFREAIPAKGSFRNEYFVVFLEVL